MIEKATAAALAGRDAFDAGLYRAVVGVSHHTGGLNGLVNWWSDYGLALFAVLAGLVWWQVRGRDLRTAAIALWVPGAMVVAFVISSVLKSVIQEQRPCRAMPTVHIATSCPGTSDYSFPSNHAVLAGAAAVAVCFAAAHLLGTATGRLLAAIAVLNALVIAASRVYIGVHYPHDVVVGLLVGGLVSAAGAFLLVKVLDRIIPAGAARLRTR
ncbi:phosphatase PAP2 family protein [Actinomadura harenae]|uniref:Phosphatase PAP2 family protein n=1 Tax=Actinomadura harenae TaxID=2483351 RepID=A0A3M2LYP1_9ACTN|nr:phosphatase PAP2 family protein [Actinomadura harenae]RMI41713.1 phosphatase PAP2 family protein [Actinomadura harenae]